jgi:hypothetical protein
MGFEENKNIYHGLTVLVALFAVYLSISRLSESDAETLGNPFRKINKIIKKSGKKIYNTGKKVYRGGKRDVKKMNKEFK